MVNLGPGVQPQSVRGFLESTYGYKHSFLPYACVILIGKVSILFYHKNLPFICMHDSIGKIYEKLILKEAYKV